MGQPCMANPYNSRFNERAEHTLGSETSQYQEEKKPIGIPLVAASETGRAQTQPQHHSARNCSAMLGMGVIRLQRWQQVELQNADVVERAGKLDPRG